MLKLQRQSQENTIGIQTKKQNEAWSSFPEHEFFETEDLQCVSVCVAEVVKVIEG